MNTESTRAFADRFWEERAIPTIRDYIEIPNLSPFFDPEWRRSGHMKKAVDLLAGWAKAQHVEGLKVEVIEPPDRTPLIFLELDGAAPGTVLLYGHLDKQPEMAGWDEDLGPWKPVRRGDRLYGRGSADDGYAIFAVLAAMRLLQEKKAAHPRLVAMIESSEESGSFDLPWYVGQLRDRIGTPSLVVCLDSGCGNYDQLWLTDSLRGVITGNLRVRVLTEGVHSGDAGGVVPSSFRILRELLDRIEDSRTGKMIPEFLHVDIPQEVVDATRRSAEILGDEVFARFPWAASTRPMGADRLELALNRTWKPSISYVGIDGMPKAAEAGNVLRPYTSIKLSIRTPPTADTAEGDRKLRELLEKDPPYGAEVKWESDGGAPGWKAPALEPWVAAALDEASKRYFGRGFAIMGEGGSIPFMGMLQAKFPAAQFVVTGVLGPHSNAHGPNEFLDIPTVQKLTCCIAEVLEKAAGR